MFSTIATNGIESSGSYNTNIEGFDWQKRLKNDIRGCIRNGYIHNYIECKGEMLFNMSDFLPIMLKVQDEVCEKEGRLVRRNEREYDEAISPIIEEWTERIFNRIVELNQE